MGLHSAPESGDVIVRETSRDGRSTCVLHTIGCAAQLSMSEYERAVSHALRRQVRRGSKEKGGPMPKRTVERLRDEFLEMPGLRLTASQIQRLCGIDAAICSHALDVLVREHFLSAKLDGTYMRLTEGRITTP